MDRSSAFLGAFSILLLGAAGCTSTQSNSGCIYPNLGLALATSATRDCGVLRLPSSDRVRRAAQSCAEKALASHDSVRFGSGWIGIDAAHCSVAIRDSSGRWWSLEHGYDISVELGEHLYVGRCSSVELRAPKSNLAPDLTPRFNLTGCAADAVGLDLVLTSIRAR
jgi:hypothetical protein